MEKDTAKLWVKVISILGFIGAIAALIAGILIFFGGTFLSTLLSLFGIRGALAGIFVGAMLITFAIVVLAWGIFLFITSLNLWRYKNWARIVGIVFAVLGVISGLMSLPVGIVTLIIYGGIFYLLAINKDVRKLFKK